MATDPIGGGPSEFSIPTGPANHGGPANFGPAQDAINTMAQNTVEMTKQMGELIQVVTAAFEKLSKSSEDVYDHVKDTVNQSDRFASNLKQSINLQKDFSNNIRGQKRTYEELQQHTQKILDFNKQMLQSGKMNAQQTKVLERNTKDLKDVLAAAAKEAQHLKANTVVSDDAMKSYSKTLAEVTRATTTLTAAQGKLEQSRLEQHIISLNRSYRDAGMQVKMFEKLEDTFRKRRAMQEVREERRTYKAASAAAAGAKFKDIGLDVGIGPQRSPQMARDRDYGDLAKQMGARGWIDKNLTARAMRARAIAAAPGGQQPGLMGRTGIGLMEAGGTVMGGAAEGGIGAIASVAGPVAAIYAVGKTIKDLYDKIAITNQAIEKGMGGALFTPGMTGGQALNTVRQNLSAPSLFNAYGQNLERNLAIAQAMQEQGLDITELSAGDITHKRLAGGGRPNTGEGFLGGAFGEFQRTAMQAGRGAGLTDTQSVVRMTKMIQEMRQTFEATHDFFYSINSQARAAGISTTKYLSIIDDLTGQFDKLNKSFNETVSIVQALGASGTNTADKIESMAKALTGAGETKTLEQKAFAFTQMTPEMRGAMQNTQRTLVANSVQKLGLALSDAGVDTSKLDLSTPHGLLMVQNTIANMPEGPQKQALQSAADDARYQMNQQAIIAAGAAGGGRGAVEAAYGTLAYGEGATLKAGQQVTLLQRALGVGGQTFEDLLKNPQQVGLKAAASAATLGIDPKDFQSALEGIVAIGSGQIQQAKAMTTGGPGSDRERQLRHFYEVGKRYGVGGLGSKFNETAMLKALNDSNIASGIAEGLEGDMSKDPSKLMDALAEKITKGNEDQINAQAKDVAMETRTTDDMMANAFEYLFKEVVDAIMGIKAILDGWSLKQFGQLFDTTGVTKGTSDMLEMMRAKGMFAESEKALREAIAVPGGNAQANAQLAQLQAYIDKPDAQRTEDEAQQIASILRANSISAYNPTSMSDADWTKLLAQPDVSAQALQEQAVRAISSQYGGGAFGDDNKFMLDPNLQKSQVDAINAMLAEAKMGKVEGTTGHQYITITMNSTDIAAFFNRYGQEMHNVKANNEVTVGPNGAVTAKKLAVVPGMAALGAAPPEMRY
jgi:hypothetical protein